MIAIIVIWLTFAPFTPAQACRQALILGLDVSRSVDHADYILQRQGLARALLDHQVMNALISARGNHVELAVFEWSGTGYQNLLVDWTVIDSPQALEGISEALIGGMRTDSTGFTALGAAMRFARDLLKGRQNCAVLTLDLSGDGKSNSGVLPETVKPEMAAAGIVVNGLIIGWGKDGVNVGKTSLTKLRSYYETKVIVGPSAFVESVLGFENYAAAIKRKLLREMIPVLTLNDQPDHRRPI